MQLRHVASPLIALTVLAAIVCGACASFAEQPESPATVQETNANQYRLVPPTRPGPPRPKILSRQEWNAKDAGGKMQPHTLRYLTIHHTASPQKMRLSIDKKMQSLQHFSQSVSRLASGKNKPAWPDVPYHYYVAVDGQIAEGRDIRYAGDTNTDYDPRGHGLVVLEGNFENERPSAQQLDSLRALVAWLSAEYEIPPSEIKAHNDYASTACPGGNLKKALPLLRQQVAELRGTVDKR